MNKKIVYIALIAFTACSGGANEKPTLAVSIEPQRKMLEELVGDKYDVVTVMTKGANPESFEPSVNQRMAVDKSKIYFTTGYLPFEYALEDNAQNVQVVNTSYGIDRIFGTHSHGDNDHPEEADPHIWTSLRNASHMALNMTNALIQIDPENQDLYFNRYEAMKSRLDSIDATIAASLSENNAHAFVVWHPSLSYFARDYGLHQIAVGQESKEQSISNLKDLIIEARQDSVHVFFFQKEYDSRQAESLNKEIGSRLVTIDPLAYDWEAELIRIADELTN